MDTPRPLTDFESTVLTAVIHLGDDAYGAKIRRHIATMQQASVSLGAVYVALDELEQRGLLVAQDVAGSEERSGRVKWLWRLR